MINTTYISAEIYVLKNTLEIEHVVYLHADGRRVLIIERKDFVAAMNYLVNQGFVPMTVQQTKSQFLITF